MYTRKSIDFNNFSEKLTSEEDGMSVIINCIHVINGSIKRLNCT